MIDLELDPVVVLLALLEIARPALVPGFILLLFGARSGLSGGPAGLIVGFALGAIGAITTVVLTMYCAAFLGYFVDLELVWLRVVLLFTATSIAAVLVNVLPGPLDRGRARLRAALILI